MRAILKARAVTDHIVWVADSFSGLPPPDTARYPHDEGITLHQFPQLALPLERVQDNFLRYGLLDSQVRFLKGWFRDTLPAAPRRPLRIHDSGARFSVRQALTRRIRDRRRLSMAPAGPRSIATGFSPWHSYPPRSPGENFTDPGLISDCVSLINEANFSTVKVNSVSSSRPSGPTHT
jgi:Macrocin-O-methyltransferase (TylF)